MSLETLKARLIERLDSADRWTPGAAAVRSDFDLNPTIERPGGALRAAAVLVPIVARADGATVILTRRADTLASHTGQIAFPGGRLDPGEAAVEAALREAWEEIALDSARVEVLGVGDPYQTGTGFLITPVVGWLTDPGALKAQPDEVADIFEAPWGFLMDVANHRRDHLEAMGGKRWFWAMTFGDRYIWGATAGVIRGLHARLHDDDTEDAA